MMQRPRVGWHHGATAVADPVSDRRTRCVACPVAGSVHRIPEGREPDAQGAAWSSADHLQRCRTPAACAAREGGEPQEALRVDPIVSPDTLLRWHQRLIAMKWTFLRKGPGRPRMMETIQGLVVRMASENPRWGYTRIQGALFNLGHKIARGTVANILKREGHRACTHAGHAYTLADVSQGALAEPRRRLLSHRKV